MCLVLAKVIERENGFAVWELRIERMRVNEGMTEKVHALVIQY